MACQVKLSIFLLIALSAIVEVQPTCVFMSDYGFTLDCAFKKSGLFRVRNLGGIKAHVGLGFSVGDELGFDQSLTNLDTSKRRSVSVRNGIPSNTIPSSDAQTDEKTLQKKMNRIIVRQPSSSPAAPTVSTSTTLKAPIVVADEEPAVQSGRSVQSSMRQMSLAKLMPSIPPFKPIPPAKTMAAPVSIKTSSTLYPVQRTTLRTVPITTAKQFVSPMTQNRMGQVPKTNLVNVSVPPMRVAFGGQNKVGAQVQVGASSESFRPIAASSVKYQTQYQPISKEDNFGSINVPVKNSVQMQFAPSVGNAQGYTASISAVPNNYNQIPEFVPQGQISNSQLQALMSGAQVYQPKPSPKIDNSINYNAGIGQNSIIDNPQNTIQEKILAISRATNISVETLEAAVRLRQQQLINQMLNTPQATSPTTTTTTTRRPPPPPPSPTPKRNQKAPDAPVSKVMNAPKEYYPVGYDKNFDDNFTTKVELPETSFYCGDQKHFPGLYADEDLGCMVFHVCALTDDGLIMKSFLCPESTLFDQTILKCNWWFYVDCKSSKKLYDSNIPISKSYQLMKALTFFSSYKKEIQGDDPSLNLAKSSITENTEGVKDAVKILQTQSQMSLPRVENLRVEVIEANSQNRSSVVRNTRGDQGFRPVNVQEVNALSSAEIDQDNLPRPKYERPRRYRNKTSAEVDIAHSTTTTSTEKSVEKSTSVERSTRVRRPVTRSKDSRESVSTLSPTSTESDATSHRRTERASEEYLDSRNHRNRADVQAKMDAAIIGRRKRRSQSVR